MGLMKGKNGMSWLRVGWKRRNTEQTSGELPLNQEQKQSQIQVRSN